MNAIDVVFDYHEQSKHHFHRYAPSLGYLDWATQPNPFRRFVGAPLHRLQLSEAPASPTYDDLYTPGAIPPQPVNGDTLSRLFEFSLALSAWKEYQGSRWALRINPSSGNLHPTEGYLVAGPIPGLHDAPAVYHYSPKEHALERRTEFSSEVWDRAARHCAEGSFFVGLTSIHWREAWKYGLRAYRYCQHDAGHALAAVSLAAAMLGWSARPLNAVSDTDLGGLLGVDRDGDFDGAEHEQPDLLLAVAPSGPTALANVEPADGALAIAQRMAGGDWLGRANSLSRDHVDWPGIVQVADACVKITASVAESPSQWLSEAMDIRRPALGAAQIIRQRRSAVAFDGRTSITTSQFYLMLDRTLPRWDRTPWNTLGPPVCVHLALFVHLVDGLEPGLYFLVRDPSKLSQLREACNATFAWTKPPECPTFLPLYMLVAGDARQAAAQVSCGQDIAGASAFSLGMIADFEEPLRKHGAWFYRRLFWETGVIGQVLYLEAEAAGVRATGIGCFFDDPVHELLGLKGHAYQSLYHFTIGGHVDDSRLTTLPPYPLQGGMRNAEL